MAWRQFRPVLGASGELILADALLIGQPGDDFKIATCDSDVPQVPMRCTDGTHEIGSLTVFGRGAPAPVSEPPERSGGGVSSEPEPGRRAGAQRREAETR